MTIDKILEKNAKKFSDVSDNISKAVTSLKSLAEKYEKAAYNFNYDNTIKFTAAKDHLHGFINFLDHVDDLVKRSQINNGKDDLEQAQRLIQEALRFCKPEILPPLNSKKSTPGSFFRTEPTPEKIAKNTLQKIEKDIDNLLKIMQKNTKQQKHEIF